LHAGVVACAKEIEPRLVVLLFPRKFLANIIAGVALCGGSSTNAREEFLTERQLEDAATPSPHAPARGLFRFSKNRKIKISESGGQVLVSSEETH
jgi:hypothetical protein